MKKILIIGATSQIAQETAKLFAQDGAHFYLTGRNKENLHAIKEDLLIRGSAKVEYQDHDVLNFEDHNLLIKNAIESLSGLDTVLIAHGSLSNQQECEEKYELIENEFKINFLSIASYLNIIVPHFEKQKFGQIAVISSVAGDRGRQSNFIYGSAKGALNIYLQGLRNKLYLYDIQVLTIKPGFVDTPMTDHLDKNILFVKPEIIAKGIYRSIKRKRNVVYLPFFWILIMTIVKLIPECIFKKLKL